MFLLVQEKNNPLGGTAGVMRFKQRLIARHQEVLRRKHEQLSYTARHQRVLEEYQIRASRSQSMTNLHDTTTRGLVYPTSMWYKIWQLVSIVVVVEYVDNESDSIYLFNDI